MTDSDRVERWWVVIARGYDGEGVARPGGGVMLVLCVQYAAASKSFPFYRPCAVCSSAGHKGVELGMSAQK